MCELVVYILKDGHEEKVMEDVASITPEGDQLVLTDVIGQQKKVKAKIKELKLMEHKAYLTP